MYITVLRFLQTLSQKTFAEELTDLTLTCTIAVNKKLGVQKLAAVLLTLLHTHCFQTSIKWITQVCACPLLICVTFV